MGDQARLSVVSQIVARTIRIVQQIWKSESGRTTLQASFPSKKKSCRVVAGDPPGLSVGNQIVARILRNCTTIWTDNHAGLFSCKEEKKAAQPIILSHIASQIATTQLQALQKRSSPPIPDNMIAAAPVDVADEIAITIHFAYGHQS